MIGEGPGSAFSARLMAFTALFRLTFTLSWTALPPPLMVGCLFWVPVPFPQGNGTGLICPPCDSQGRLLSEGRFLVLVRQWSIWAVRTCLSPPPPLVFGGACVIPRYRSPPPVPLVQGRILWLYALWYGLVPAGLRTRVLEVSSSLEILVLFLGTTSTMVGVMVYFLDSESSDNEDSPPLLGVPGPPFMLRSIQGVSASTLVPVS